MIFANKNILSVSGVTSDQGHQYQERITWTNPCSGDSHTSETFTATTFEAEDLAHLLLGMYSKMFALERSSHIVASVTPSELELLSRVTFNRESVAHLFKAVQRRCYLRNGTWDHVAKKFLEICGTGDDCPAEPSNYQDLCLQLHLAGVFTSETLRPDWATKSRLIPHSPLFDGWESIPPVVCVVLTVPRRRLQIFGGEVEGVNTLAMQCRLITGNLDHDHSSIHVIWGRCIKARDSDHMVIAEDDCGLFGHSNLLVTFWASACLLDSPDVKVDLRLKSTPESVIACGNILGVNLQVFSTSITDKHHVTVLPYCPTLASEPLRYPPSGQQPDPPLPTWPGKVCEAVVTKPAKRHVDLLSVRFHITFPEEQKSLLKGVQVSAKQTSPCTMQLSIGEHIHPIVFSYPIQGRNSRVRIARKSQYVDIIVPVSKPLDHSGYFLDPFPVLGKHAYTSWNISLFRGPRFSLGRTTGSADPAEIEEIPEEPARRLPPLVEPRLGRPIEAGREEPVREDANVLLRMYLPLVQLIETSYLTISEAEWLHRDDSFRSLRDREEEQSLRTMAIPLAALQTVNQATEEAKGPQMDHLTDRETDQTTI
ncbi:hypothetical protein RSOL_050490, partial [Rhizoctonia solani AG-3 Rhs1AP]